MRLSELAGACSSTSPSSFDVYRKVVAVVQRLDDAQLQFQLAIGDIESAVKDAAAASADLEAAGGEIPLGLFNRLRGIQSLLAPLLSIEGSPADPD